MDASAKVLRIGILAPITTLDPRKARDLLNTLATAQVYETPYLAPKGDEPPEPLLFEGPLSAEAGAENVLLGKVRDKVVFSDGTPLTAERVAASLVQVDSVAAEAAVEARGEKVRFRLRRGNPRFELALTLMHCGVVLEKGGQRFGTGPYLPEPGAPLEALRLVRNPRYRGEVAIDALEFRVYPPDPDGRPAALIRAVESGEVDFTGMLSRDDAAAVAGVKKAFLPSASTAVLYLNTERPALRSPEVRRAIAHAVDRLAITEVSYSNALAFVASSLLPSIMGRAHDGLAHDPEKAKKLLAQAGGVPPARLRLVTVWAPRPYLPNPRPVADLIARQLAGMGIGVEVHTPASVDDFFRLIESGDYDMVLGGWIADTPDPADFLEANLRSDRMVRGGAKAGLTGFNLARFASPAMDEALDRFRADPRPENRNRILSLLTEQVPVVPLMYGPTVAVHAWRVKNVVVSPLGVPSFGRFTLAD